MKKIEDIFKETGASNMDELSAHIEGIQKQNADLETELAEVKKERTSAKSEATKATNRANDLSEKVESLTQDIEDLKNKAAGKIKGALSTEKLKEKALIIMKQEGVNKAFVSPKGEVFLNETYAANKCGTKYKIAELIDDEKVQFKNP